MPYSESKSLTDLTGLKMSKKCCGQFLLIFWPQSQKQPLPLGVSFNQVTSLVPYTSADKETILNIIIKTLPSGMN